MNCDFDHMKHRLYCVACQQEILMEKVMADESSRFCSICMNALCAFDDDASSAASVGVRKTADPKQVHHHESHEMVSPSSSRAKKRKTNTYDYDRDRKLLGVHVIDLTSYDDNKMTSLADSKFSYEISANASDDNNNDDINEKKYDDTVKVTSKSNKNVFHPHDVIDPSFFIPYPRSLSPSSIATFKKCPQLYLFRYLLPPMEVEELTVVTTPAIVKGTLCHAALENIFDVQPPSDRTLTKLYEIFLTFWSEYRHDEPYSSLFMIKVNTLPDNDGQEKELVIYDAEAENIWKQECLQLLTNYWYKDKPTQISQPNPIYREVSVCAKLHANYFASLPLSSTKHIDLYPSSCMNQVVPDAHNDFMVRGIIDRLDIVHSSDNEHEPWTLRVIDYKTGKAPCLKYSSYMNDKIRKDAFEQLLIYALLLNENYRNEINLKRMTNTTTTVNSDSSGIPSTSGIMNLIPVRYLRIFYLNSECTKSDIEGPEIDQNNKTKQDDESLSSAVYWDFDLGSSQEERDIILNNTYYDLILVWRALIGMVSEQNIKSFYGCDHRRNPLFCDCHIYRSLFPSGSIWEPVNSSSNGL